MIIYKNINNKTMDNYRAVGLAEGFIETEDTDEILEAWQYLHDTGLAYKLQGCFGKKAKEFLDLGLIK